MMRELIHLLCRAAWTNNPAGISSSTLKLKVNEIPALYIPKEKINGAMVINNNEKGPKLLSTLRRSYLIRPQSSIVDDDIN